MGKILRWHCFCVSSFLLLLEFSCALEVHFLDVDSEIGEIHKWQENVDHVKHDTSQVTNFSEIPYEDRIKFGKVTDLKEFFRRFVIPPKHNKTEVSTRRPGRPTFRGRGRSGNVNARPFGVDIPSGSVCHPINKTVPVPIMVSPLHIILPKCITIERCSGCCNDETHVCESIRSDNVTHKFTKLRYVFNSSQPFEIEDTKYYAFRRDLQCSCQCRKKAEHCTSPYHIYNPDECSCICTNLEERRICDDSSDVKYWDNDSCTCRCQEKMKHCSSGFVYDDQGVCDCVPDGNSTLVGLEETMTALESVAENSNDLVL